MGNIRGNTIVALLAVIVGVLVVGAIAFMLGRESIDEQSSAQPESSTTRQQEVNSSSQNPLAGGSDDAATNQDGVTGSAVSREDAGRIAQEAFGGVIDDIDANSHNGRPTWEVELDNSREGDIEVDIDRETGEILHWEND